MSKLNKLTELLKLADLLNDKSDCDSENIKLEDGRHVLVRSYADGVHIGKIISKEYAANGVNVVLEDSINIWRWDGAAGLNQLATDGTNDPDNCKFTVPVSRREIMNVVSIIELTDKALKSIKGVKSWIR